MRRAIMVRDPDKNKSDWSQIQAWFLIVCVHRLISFRSRVNNTALKFLQFYQGIKISHGRVLQATFSSGFFQAVAQHDVA